jgi:folylpolyglutamate synthase/dihydropteroate synthase
MLLALDARKARLVVACPPPSPRALPPDDLVAAAHGLGIDAVATGSVPEAVARALDSAEPTEMVLVSGSLYVVGSARAALRGEPTVH